MKTKKIETKQDVAKFSREEILKKCRARPTEDVLVQGWGGTVTMQNVTFPELVQLRKDCADEDDYRPMLVAAVCADLDIADAIELQRGNGARFSELFASVNKYLDTDFGEDEIKK